MIKSMLHDRSRTVLLLIPALVMVFSAYVFGQTASPSPADNAPKRDSLKNAIGRWFEIEQLTTSVRYHFIENDNKTKAADNLQYQFVAKFRFKFDKSGKYSVHTNLATGSSFTTFWNATGVGSGSYQKDVNLRQLYFDAKPNKAVEIQFGGLYVNYGDVTEALTYDNDSYITGARVQIRSPKNLYFDEISATTATLADVNRPDTFHRLKHLGTQNYHQFLIRKQFTKNIGVTGDYTFENGIDTFHEAVKIKIPPKHFVDSLLFENYQRVDPDRNYGFNLYGEKKLNRTFTAGGGFADIHIRALNGDRFPPGKRVYANGIAKLSPEFTFTLQLTQGVGPLQPSIARTRFDFFMTYNILESLKRTKLF